MHRSHNVFHTKQLIFHLTAITTLFCLTPGDNSASIGHSCECILGRKYLPDPTQVSLDICAITTRIRITPAHQCPIKFQCSKGPGVSNNGSHIHQLILHQVAVPTGICVTTGHYFSIYLHGSHSCFGEEELQNILLCHFFLLIRHLVKHFMAPDFQSAIDDSSKAPPKLVSSDSHIFTSQDSRNLCTILQTSGLKTRRLFKL
mmetsp:Transcript_84740/g.103897  ORF Transcript_84740/g.103897 Transcript_84740/m.103897 type:complete len:202 (-) Transcript_84740:175-780(-)